MNADGSGKKTLYHEVGSSGFDPNWSPDGDLILFSIGHYFRAPGIPPSQIATIRRNGSGFTPIVADGANNDVPTCSPDGKQIVYKHGKHLVRRNLADGNVVQLTDGTYYGNFPSGNRTAIASCSPAIAMAGSSCTPCVPMALM